MNYEIIELKEFTGKGATVYSVLFEGEENSLFDLFVEENIREYEIEVKSIVGRLEQMGLSLGTRAQFFKEAEGAPGDGVCALYDQPNSKLRLYCIRFGNVAIILGGGGPKFVRAWQEDAKLNLEAKRMIQISKDIFEKIRSGELGWSRDGYQLMGNLLISSDDE